MKYTPQEAIASIIFSLYYLSNIIYSFIQYGAEIGIINLFLPYALFFDLIIKIF